ncbi:MAG: hypothetical protein J0M24_03735 [Verrucomicrobia bacterium]|nr:hypothetical protein [Verrucomicrobiota bacterium]
MKLRKAWIGFWLLSAVSVAAVGFSIYARTMSGVLIYDRNFEIFSEETGKLSRAEVDHIVRAGREAVSVASWPLLPVLGAWIIGGFIHLVALRPNEK